MGRIEHRDSSLTELDFLQPRGNFSLAILCYTCMYKSLSHITHSIRKYQTKFLNHQWGSIYESFKILCRAGPDTRGNSLNWIHQYR